MRNTSNIKFFLLTSQDRESEQIDGVVFLHVVKANWCTAVLNM